MPELSLSQLKEFVFYDPDTGVFTVLKRRGSRGKPVGSILGSKHQGGYLEARIFQRNYLLHRLAFFYTHGYMPIEVDHINHDRTDNRIINIREATRRENAKNTSLNIQNANGNCGVHWTKSRNKWVAYITVNRKRLHLGLFNDINDAIAVRKAAEIKYGFHPNHGT